MDIKTKGFEMPDGNIHVFIPPSPTETERGGIKAKAKTTENVEVVIGDDDKLYVPPYPTTIPTLQTPRGIQTDLGSNSPASFDGSSDITPGVTGTLSPANGGTGQTTTKAAANSFINSLDIDIGGSKPQDNDYYISQYVSGGTSTTTYHRRPMSTLWEYIKEKISSVLGLTVSSYGGNATTATKLGSSTVGSGTKPIYLDAGTATASNSTVGSIDIPVYMNAGTITSTGKSFSSYLPLSGGTLTDPNNINFKTSSNLVIKRNVSSILQSPIPKYLWHDVFAFGNYNPTYQTTTDGTTWNDATVNLNLFAQKEDQSIPVLTDTIIGSRWTFSNVHYNLANYIAIGFGYTAPAPETTVTIEGSKDQATWMVLHSSTNNFSRDPAWFYIPPITDYMYLRITLSKESTDTGICNISCIKCLTTRCGTQGKGSELEYPYTWDAEKNITAKGTFTGTFNGTATKATQDSSGQQINTTYIKELSISDGTITYTKGDGTTGTISLPVYNGEYVVTPSATEEQVLSTSQTYTTANIRISKIPYSEESNSSNGTTVTIG